MSTKKTLITVVIGLGTLCILALIVFFFLTPIEIQSGNTKVLIGKRDLPIVDRSYLQELERLKEENKRLQQTGLTSLRPLDSLKHSEGIDEKKLDISLIFQCFKVGSSYCSECLGTVNHYHELVHDYGFASTKALFKRALPASPVFTSYFDTIRVNGDVITFYKGSESVQMFLTRDLCLVSYWPLRKYLAISPLIPILFCFIYACCFVNWIEEEVRRRWKWKMIYIPLSISGILLIAYLVIRSISFFCF